MRDKFTWFGKLSIFLRRNDPLIMEALSAERQTYHIDEIQTSLGKKEIRLRKYKEELQRYMSKNDEHLTGVDEDWDVQWHYEVPIMKPNEVVVARRNNINWWFVTFILLVFDSFFASLIVPFLLPAIGPVWVKILIGAAVAIIIIIFCEAGFRNLGKYYEGKLLLKKGELPQEILAKVNNKLTSAVLLLTIGIIATLSIAIVRYIFLEGINVSSESNNILKELNEKLIKGSKYAAGTTFVLAFIVILLFGIYSLRKHKYATRYTLYKKYEKNNRRIGNLINKINKLNKLYQHCISDNLESSWSLMLHIRKILKRIVDAENKNKEAEFLFLLEKEKFIIDDDLSRKYSSVASCNRELFIYRIDESKEVRIIKNSWQKLMDEINKLIEKYKDTHNYKIKSVTAKPGSILSPLRIFFFALIFLFSCTKHKSLNVVGFVDLSSSTNARSQKFFLQVMREVLNYLPFGSRLTVLPIDASTEKGSVEFVTISIPEKEIFENELDPPNQKQTLEEMRFTTFKDSIIKTVELGLAEMLPSNRDSNDNKQTDILGAFRLLSRYDDSTKTNTVPISLIFSDMMNYNEELDIEKKNYDSVAQKKIIADLRKVDLSKWQIMILTGQPKISSEKYLITKEFWFRYLKECKNTNVVYESGATSIVFNKVKEIAESKKSFFGF